eukprot:RCo030691
MRRALRLLMERGPSLGSKLRQTADATCMAKIGSQMGTDIEKDVEEKASVFLQTLMPRLEKAANLGQYEWQFQFLEEYPNDKGIPVVEDEYGFKWVHLAENFPLYRRWFKKQDLNLEVRVYKSENRDAAVANIVRRILVRWDEEALAPPTTESAAKKEESASHVPA